MRIMFIGSGFLVRYLDMGPGFYFLDCFKVLTPGPCF